MCLKNISKHKFYIFIIILILFFLFLSLMTNIYPKESTSSLYLLSALAQSQAAIFAIVISLNLLGVQIISTVYSSRVVSIFSDDFKYLWGLYGISIFYDIILMNTLPNNLDQSHHILIIASILVAILAFIAIIPLINNTINLLNPQNIIKKLSQNNDLSAEEQLFDFIVGSIKQNDFNSYSNGLSELYKITQKNDATDEKIERILTIFYRIGRFTISLRNEEATIEIIELLGKVGLTQNIQKIEDLAKYSARNKLEYTTIKGIETLSLIFSTIPFNTITDAFLILDIQRAAADIGRISSEMHLEDSTLKSARAIHDMVLKTIESEQEIFPNTPKLLGRLGTSSAENKWEMSTEKILVTLGEIVINSITQKNNITNLTIDKIGQISLICAKNDLEEAVLISFDSFKVVVDISSGDMINIISLIRRWVEMIKEHSKKNGFENINISNQANSMLETLNANFN